MRHYANGEIVGTEDPPKTWEEFFVWLDSEFELAKKKASRQKLFITYLTGRKQALAEVLYQMRGLRD